MNSTKLPEIKDIKPPVEIGDYSIYLFILVVILGVVVLAILLWWIFKEIKRVKKVNRAKQYLEALHNIDWSDPKSASYKITEYGRLLATDEKRQEIFANLLPLLEQYKYKKDVNQRVDPKTLREFELFKQVCDESI